MAGLLDLSPSEMAEEAARRMARRRAGLPLTEESPKTAPYVSRLEAVWTESQSRVVTLPWSVLVPDGERFAAAARRKSDGGWRALLVMTARYKRAKKAAREMLREQVGDAAPLAGRVQFTATLFEPNASRVRDISNLAKMCQDALSGIVYIDDGQIDDLRWRRGNPDIDRPRLEISVTEIGK